MVSIMKLNITSHSTIDDSCNKFSDWFQQSNTSKLTFPIFGIRTHIAWDNQKGMWPEQKASWTKLITICQGSGFLLLICIYIFIWSTIRLLAPWHFPFFRCERAILISSSPGTESSTWNNTGTIKNILGKFSSFVYNYWCSVWKVLVSLQVGLKVHPVTFRYHFFNSENAPRGLLLYNLGSMNSPAFSIQIFQSHFNNWEMHWEIFWKALGNNFLQLAAW